MNRAARVLASGHSGFGIDLFQENLYFVNCRKEYAIRPLRIIPDSSNQLAALALRLSFLSNEEIPDVKQKLEYDATIQSMRYSAPPKRRDQHTFFNHIRILTVFGNRRGGGFIRKAEHLNFMERDGGFVSLLDRSYG